MDDVGELLDKIGDISAQLGTFIYKTNDLKEQIKDVCDTAAERDKEIQELAKNIAVIKTQIEYLIKAYEDMNKKVEGVQEFTWKQAGFVAGISFAISLVTFFLGLKVF